MIVKSIAIRIHREGKKAPVILDDYFLSSLESLIKVRFFEDACATI